MSDRLYGFATLRGEIILHRPPEGATLVFSGPDRLKFDHGFLKTGVVIDGPAEIQGTSLLFRGAAAVLQTAIEACVERSADGRLLVPNFPEPLTREMAECSESATANWRLLVFQSWRALHDAVRAKIDQISAEAV